MCVCVGMFGTLRVTCNFDVNARVCVLRKRTRSSCQSLLMCVASMETFLRRDVVSVETLGTFPPKRHLPSLARDQTARKLS